MTECHTVLSRQLKVNIHLYRQADMLKVHSIYLERKLSTFIDMHYVDKLKGCPDLHILLQSHSTTELFSTCITAVMQALAATASRPKASNSYRNR